MPERDPVDESFLRWAPREDLIGRIDALAARVQELEAALREARVLLDHYDRTSSLDPGNNRRMGALRRRFRAALRAEGATDEGA